MAQKRIVIKNKRYKNVHGNYENKIKTKIK